MITKPLTKAEREALYNKLKSHMDYLVNDPDNLGSKKVLDAWFTWNKLSHADQVKILNDWTKYYDTVYETPSAQIFQEQRTAAKNGDWGRVKELSTDARTIKENKDYVLKQPTSIDPWEFNHNQDVKGYLEIKEKIKELTNYSDIKQETDLKEVFS